MAILRKSGNQMRQGGPGTDIKTFKKSFTVTMEPCNQIKTIKLQQQTRFNFLLDHNCNLPEEILNLLIRRQNQKKVTRKLQLAMLE